MGTKHGDRRNVSGRVPNPCGFGSARVGLSFSSCHIPQDSPERRLGELERFELSSVPDSDRVQTGTDGRAYLIDTPQVQGGGWPILAGLGFARVG